MNKNFKFDSRPLVEGETAILLVWIIMFGVVAASIPLGTAVGFTTIYLLNSFGWADLSIHPQISAGSSAIISSWIFITAVYFFFQVRREAVRSFQIKEIVKSFAIKPAIFIGVYFGILILIGMF